MAIDTNKLVIGEGNLSLQFASDGSPVDVGACEGFTLDIKPKVLDVKCGQSLLPIESFIIDKECGGSIELLELAALRNLVIAMGGDPSTIVDADGLLTFTIKSASTEAPPVAQLIYEVPRVQDTTKNITITLYRIRSKGGATISMKKDKEGRVKFEFTALADSTQDNDVGTYVVEKLDTE